MLLTYNYTYSFYRFFQDPWPNMTYCSIYFLFFSFIFFFIEKDYWLWCSFNKICGSAIPIIVNYDQNGYWYKGISNWIFKLGLCLYQFIWYKQNIFVRGMNHLQVEAFYTKCVLSYKIYELNLPNSCISTWHLSIEIQT